MNQRRWTWFLLTSVLLVTVGLALGATVLPPDPVSQLPGFVMAVVFGVGVAYWFVYRRGAFA